MQNLRDAKIGQVQLVARNEERHSLLDQPLAFVGCQRVGDVDDRKLGRGSQAIHLRAQFPKLRLVAPLFFCKQDGMAVQRQLAGSKGFLQEVREFPGAGPRAQAGGQAQGVVQIPLDGCVGWWLGDHLL